MQRCSLLQPKTGEKLTNEFNCQVREACKYHKSYIVYKIRMIQIQIKAEIF